MTRFCGAFILGFAAFLAIALPAWSDHLLVGVIIGIWTGFGLFWLTHPGRAQ